MEHFKTIGKRLREIRLEENITGEELSRKLSLPGSALSNIELGNGANTKVFLTIVLYYVEIGYSLNWILEIDNAEYFKKKNQEVFLTSDTKDIKALFQNIKGSTNKLINIIEKYH